MLLRRLFSGLFDAAPRGTQYLQGTGIEIGAHNLPIAGISPIYVDRFVEYAGTKCLVDVVADAGALPFAHESLDYVASSHVLEHLPNPILTLLEWYYCLKRGGMLYMVVPDRRFTFDHLRDRTPLSHLIDDFDRATTACDPTHIDDFIGKVDLARLSPDLPAEEFDTFREQQRAAYHREVAAGREINLHFHVFEKEDVVALVNFMATSERTRCRWAVVETAERYPPNRADGFLLVVRKR